MRLRSRLLLGGGAQGSVKRVCEVPWGFDGRLLTKVSEWDVEGEREMGTVVIDEALFEAERLSREPDLRAAKESFPNQP